MVARKPSSQFTSSSKSSSRSSSLYTSSAITEGWDADTEESMSAEDIVPSRPLSVAIPKAPGAHGPYCPRRPGLKEILANTSPAPWTLAAFMAYLSNNHCLETLEFTMDAGRYKKHYAKMMAKAEDAGMPPAKDCEYVQLLWNRLIDAYIQPNGSREVNLPSEVRDPILGLGPDPLPPSPEKLDPAVVKIYELMEESVLVPFLNSCYPQNDDSSVSSVPYNVSSESLSSASKSRESSSHGFRRHGRGHRSSPPPQTPVDTHASSFPSIANRKSAPSSLTTSLNKARFSMKLSPTSSSPSTVAPFSPAVTSGIPEATTLSATNSGSDSRPGLTTDDSGSQGSPTNESPMTPPTSPPMSDLGAPSPAHSPKHSRDSGMWKKLGRLSGMKVGKKKSASGLKIEEQ